LAIPTIQLGDPRDLHYIAAYIKTEQSMPRWNSC
jgi:hypothetical protein